MTKALTELVQTILSDPDLKLAIVEYVKAVTPDTNPGFDTLVQYVSKDTRSLSYKLDPTQRSDFRLNFKALYNENRSVVIAVAWLKLDQSNPWQFDFYEATPLFHDASIVDGVVGAVRYADVSWRRVQKIWRKIYDGDAAPSR